MQQRKRVRLRSINHHSALNRPMTKSISTSQVSDDDLLAQQLDIKNSFNERNDRYNDGKLDCERLHQKNECKRDIPYACEGYDKS